MILELLRRVGDSMRKAGVVPSVVSLVSDRVVPSEGSSLSSSGVSAFLGAGTGISVVPTEKFRFCSSRAREWRVSRAVSPDSSSFSISCSVTGLGLVREARMISCSAGGNSRKNSLSSGDKKARGSSLVTDGPGGTVVVLVETGSVTTERK